MLKKLFTAAVTVPEYPRVRFMRKSTLTDGPKFIDHTLSVVRIEVEALLDGSGICLINRFDAQDALVAQTRHGSLDEVFWHCNFEYCLEDADLIICE